MLVFKKQVDNLKTNHRGVYVLTDNVFRPLSRMSTDAGGQAVARAQPVCYTFISCSPTTFLAVPYSSVKANTPQWGRAFYIGNGLPRDSW